MDWWPFVPVPASTANPGALRCPGVITIPLWSSVTVFPGKAMTITESCALISFCHEVRYFLYKEGSQKNGGGNDFQAFRLESKLSETWMF